MEMQRFKIIETAYKKLKISTTSFQNKYHQGNGFGHKNKQTDH